MKKKSRLSLFMIIFFQLLSGITLQAAVLPDTPKIHAATKAAVRVCPGSSITATLQSTGFVQAEVSVQNAGGKLLINRPVVLDPGENLLQFKISEIPQGAYFLKVKSENGTEKITFIVY